jgi:hypothetical protein
LPEKKRDWQMGRVTFVERFNSPDIVLPRRDVRDTSNATVRYTITGVDTVDQFPKRILC